MKIEVEIDDKLLEEYRKVSPVPLELMLKELIEEALKALTKLEKDVLINGNGDKNTPPGFLNSE